MLGLALLDVQVRIWERRKPAISGALVLWRAPERRVLSSRMRLEWEEQTGSLHRPEVHFSMLYVISTMMT